MSAEKETTEPKNKVQIEDAGPCKKKVIIEIPQESIANAANEQYRTLRKEADVPGFRVGRAPRRLLEKKFGKETSEQVKLKLLADASDTAIKDNNLNILRDPDIDFESVELPATGPMTFNFEIEVRPEFDLPELEGIAVNKTKLEVTGDQVDTELEQMRKYSGLWAPKDGGKVELDDQIIADVITKFDDAEEEEKLDNTEIFVRQNGFVASVPVEKLDKLLVGAKIGDAKETSVDIPKTYFREEYRGKKANVKITIKDIKFLKPAEINADFLSRFGVDDEKELRDRIQDSLQGRLEQQTKREMVEQIYKYMLDKTKFDLPTNIVAEQATSILQRQYANLLSRGLGREQLDEQMEKLKASSDQQAEEQLKTFFIMDKVAEKFEISVSEEEINGHIAQLAIQQGQRPEQMREQMARDGSLSQFSMQVREDKCIDKILQSAKITEVKAKKEAKKVEKTEKTAAKTAEKPKKTAKKADNKEKKSPKKTKKATKKKTKE